jgi:hypothetical protein
MMRVLRADQNAVPLPSAALGWLDQNEHLSSEEIGGKSTEHFFGEEACVILEGLKDPFIVECLHQYVSSRSEFRGRPPNSL